MNEERLSDSLVKLGLSEIEAKIYVNLTINGTQIATELAKALNISVSQVCRSLESLKNKSYVSVAHKQGTYFSAEPLEKILAIMEQSIRSKNLEAQAILLNKEALMQRWRMMMDNHSTLDAKNHSWIE